MTATLAVSGGVGFKPEARLWVWGAVHQERITARLVVVGGVGDRAVRAQLPTYGGIGTAAQPVGSGATVYSRVTGTAQTPLAFSHSHALFNGPEQTLTVLSQWPPVAPVATVEQGVNDAPPSASLRYAELVGLMSRSASHAGYYTATVATDGNPPELDEPLPELIPQPPPPNQDRDDDYTSVPDLPDEDEMFPPDESEDDWADNEDVDPNDPNAGLPGGAKNPNSDECISYSFYRARRTPRRKPALEVAAAHVGIPINWVSGPMLPDPKRRVYSGYSTAGRTLREVLNELVGESGARWWYEAGIVHVDGRHVNRRHSLPASLWDPNTDGISAGDMSWSDDKPMFPPELDENGDPIPVADPPPEGGSIEEPPGSGNVVTYPPQDPQLPPSHDPSERYPAYPKDDAPRPRPEDYVATCSVTSTEIGNVEQDPDNSWSYTTKGGAGEGYTETEHYIEKVGGRITKTRETVRGWRITHKSENMLIRTFGPIQESTKHYTYDSLCPQAVLATRETIWAWPGMDAVEGAPQQPLPEDAPPWRATDEQEWYRAMPKPYLESSIYTVSAWHPEGWLRTRREDRKRHLGFAFQKTPHPILTDTFSYRVIPLYRTESRQESNMPVGGGMWHAAVRESFVEAKTVLSNPDPDIPEDVQPMRVTNESAAHSYTIVTDQAPPTVSCPTGCIDVTDCSSMGRERYAFDLDTYLPRQYEDPEPELDDPEGDEHPVGGRAPRDPIWPYPVPGWPPDDDALPERDPSTGNLDPKRVWTVNYRRWRPELKVGLIDSDAVIAGVSHDWQDGGPVTTTATIWTYL